MSNEKMRREFEDWAATHSYLCSVDIDLMRSGEYSDIDLQHAWESWQASRAALCVELPNRCAWECLDSSEQFVQLTYELDGNDPVPLVRLPDVISAIESTGVRTR